MRIPPKRRPATWRPSEDVWLLRAKRTISAGIRWSDTPAMAEAYEMGEEIA
jgi:hypothetical protein